MTEQTPSREPVVDGRAPSAPTRTDSARNPRRALPTMLVSALFAVLAAIGLLRRFEYQIPQWLAETPPQAESVLVVKSERRLYLIRDGEPYRSWRVALGGNPIGHKQREGDLRTPEGEYVLDWRNPGSCCYRSLHVSYPDAADFAAAGARGDDPGGLIMIHGQVNGWGWLGWLMQYRDHTHGCIAVRNVPMEVIWRAVDDGTPIEIRP